jgi:hypothetical protein
VSVEKLLTYSDRLKMKTTLTVHASSGAYRNAQSLSRLPVRSTAKSRSGSRNARRQAAAIG